MSRLITIAVLMVAVAAPAFACDWNKSAATDSQSTVASHSGEQAPHCGRSRKGAHESPWSDSPGHDKHRKSQLVRRCSLRFSIEVQRDDVPQHPRDRGSTTAPSCDIAQSLLTAFHEQ